MRRTAAIGSASLLAFALAAYSAIAAIGQPPLPAATESPPAPVIVRIVSPVIVSDENVQLGKIGEIRAVRMRDREELFELSVARMPEGKDSIELPARYVESRVREILGAERAIEFEMPPVIELRRQSRRLTHERVSAEIAKLARERGRIPEGIEARIELASLPTEIEFGPDKKIIVAPRIENGDWHGAMLFRVSLVDGNGTESNGMFVQARIRWYGKRWVSTRTIPYKTPLRTEDFENVEIELSPAKMYPVLASERQEFEKLVSGAYAGRALIKGQPLLAAQIARDPDVVRGQKLKVILKSESGLRVIAPGEAMNNATVGGQAKARLSRTGRIVSGQLVDKEVMEIGL